MTSVNRASETRGSAGPKESNGGDSGLIGGLTSPEALIGTSVALTAASFVPMAAPIATPLRVAATVVAAAGVYQAVSGGDEGAEENEEANTGAAKQRKTDAPKADGKEPQVEVAKGEAGKAEGAPKIGPNVLNQGSQLQVADTSPAAPAPRTLEAHASVDAKGTAPTAVAA